jgi:hypothetical protein
MNDVIGGILGLLFTFGSLFGIVYLFFVVFVRPHNVQAAREYLCLGCETVSSNNFERRPSWPWFIVGPFALLWPKKMTCRTCKSHELVPVESPRAQKVLAAAASK